MALLSVVERFSKALKKASAVLEGMPRRRRHLHFSGGENTVQ
jgi:hypothetical protein